MNYRHFILWVILIFIVSCDEKESKTELSFVKLTCNHQENPILIKNLKPGFSWVMNAQGFNKSQAAYHIQIAASPEILKEGTSTIWDSKKVTSSESIQVAYMGSQLDFNTTYYWRVKIWDEKNVASLWSPIQHFTTSLKESAWEKAKWIGNPKDKRTSEHRFRKYQTSKMSTPIDKASFPTGYFRKTLDIKKSVKSAKAFVAGLGYYELYLNGEKVGDHVLDPAPSNYDKNSLYVAFDATTYLKDGKNAIGLILGNGFYGQNLAFVGERESQKKMEYGAPVVKMLLEICYNDGTTEIIGTNENWNALSGPIVFDNVYSGEVYDARFEIPDWNTTDFMAENGTKAKVIPSPVVGQLVPQVMPAIKKLKELSPKKIFKADNGNWILDFGQNIAGWVKINVKESEGHRIDLQLVEALKRKGKAIHLGATGGGASGFSQQLTYICKGEQFETWEPRFTYHGFQYAEISGLTKKPLKENFTAILVATDVEETGSFESSDALLNKMDEISRWTLVDNLHGIPEDCPQREKCGWLGDAHAWAEFGLYNYDLTNFNQKFMEDIRTQFRTVKGNLKKNDFKVPTMIAPGKRTSSIAKLDWGIATIYIPWYTYLHSGDSTLINEYYNDMKQLAAYYLTFKSEAGIIDNGMGDWCPPKWDRRKNPEAMECHPVISASAYFYDVLKIMREFAILKEDKQYIDFLDTELTSLKSRFNNAYLKEISGTPHKWYGSQTATIMALQFDLVPETEVKNVLNGLLYDIHVVNRGHHTTGIHGNRYLYSILSKLGEAEAAYNVLTHPEFPSQAFVTNYGFTTWPERQWNWESGIELSNSLNHPMHSGFAAYFYETLGGIRPSAKQSGYKQFTVNPIFPSSLKETSVSIATPYGKISNNWTMSGQDFEMNLTVPFNTSAIVSLTPQEKETLLVNGEDWKNYQGKEESINMLQLGSGTYKITYVK